MSGNEGRSVVLVVPPLIHAGVAFTSVAGPEHIGVAYLAAALRREGIRTEILNFDLDTYIRVIRNDGFLERQPTADEMADKIVAVNPDFVGITVTGPTLETSLAIATALKQRRADLHVCFGGHQATAAGESMMAEEPIIDSVGLGDCDFTLPAFVTHLWNGEDLEHFHGFYSRKSGGSVVGGWKVGARKGDLIRIKPSPPLNAYDAQKYALWDLPHPARDDLRTIRKETGANEARLSTSRGCMDFCTFCATSDRAGFRRHTLRPPSDVVDEVEKLHAQYGIDHFWLVDDNFVSRSPESQERAAAICRALIASPLRVTMRAYFRADAFDGREELIPLLFRAGVIMGLIGVESATPRRLKYFGKQCTSDQVRSTIKAIRHFGMGLQIGYIFYDPLTSFPDMRADADFLLEIGEAYNLFNFVQSMDVYPGTPYRRMIQKKGIGHFEHAYRGGFRQYDYEDPRIAPLAALVDRLYDPSMMAADRSLMRLRAFNLPRLRWFDEGHLLSATERQKYSEFRNLSEEQFDHLSRLHHRWKHEVIDLAESERDSSAIEAAFRVLQLQRQDPIEKLLGLAREADRLGSKIHASVNRVPPSGTASLEEVL